MRNAQVSSNLQCNSAFRPAWWLRSAHAQTLLPRFTTYTAPLKLLRQRITLPDGDFIDLDWTKDTPTDKPVVLLLHGLEGSSRSPYMIGMLRALAQLGWQGVALNFRGCSGEPNRSLRGYHSGETGDLSHILSLLHEQYPQQPLCAIGYSLGANVLLKYLGEHGNRTNLKAAAAVSVPFDLQTSVRRLEHGFSRIYQHYLLYCLKRKMRERIAALGAGILSPTRIAGSRTLTEFDDCVTAPLFDFADANDYYKRSSCRGVLNTIAVPTLVVHAQDDPFMVPSIIPHARELSTSVHLEVSRYGGHVGFIGGHIPGVPHYWLEQRIPQFLQDTLARGNA